MEKKKGPAIISHGYAYGGVQVFLPWHIRNVPVPMQLGSPCPPVRVQIPVTTPLLRVPVTPAVALEVPVRFPVSFSTLPAGVTELTVRSRVPVTDPFEAVVKLALPFSVVLLRVVPKHAP